MDRLTRTILITGIIILYHSSVFPEEADYSPIAKNTVTLNLQTELREESTFSTWGWMWKANQEPGWLALGGLSASFFPKEGAEIGVRYMRPSDSGMRDTVVMSYGERYKWKRINGDSFEIFSRVYLTGKKNHFFSGILGAGRLSSIQYSYQREFPDGVIWKKSEMENLVRENFPFSPPGLPDTADIFLSSRVYTSAGIGYLYAFGSLRINVDLEIKMPFKESRKVLVNSDPKYFVNAPAYTLPEVYARQILISNISDRLSSRRDGLWSLNVSFGIGF
ncbi:MAG TPA: hypothetical protein PKV80_26210 [Leptospiraceae bacterium]|nr:hypothetical protein [Leptospiraceae bacterium]HNI97716.1 hypothetical protein [Leptospiraceae bacterium]